MELPSVEIAEMEALIPELRELARGEFQLSEQDADDVVEMTLLRAASVKVQRPENIGLSEWLRAIVREEATLHLETLTH